MKIKAPKPPKQSRAEKDVAAASDAQETSDQSRREADASSAFKGLLGARAFLGGSGYGGYLR